MNTASVLENFEKTFVNDDGNNEGNVDGNNDGKGKRNGKKNKKKFLGVGPTQGICSVLKVTQ